MYFKGFKIAVTVNFAVLLIIGMVLTHIVVTFFWQQHVINLSINRAKLLLSAYNLILGDELSDNRVTFFENHKDKISNFQVSLGLMSDGAVFAEREGLSRNLEKVLRQSAAAQSEIISSTGSFWSVFGLSVREIYVAVPSMDCESYEAVGALVHVPELSKYISEKQSAIIVYILVNAIVLTTLWFFRMRRLVIKPLENLVAMSESFGMAASDFMAASPQKNEFGQLATALSNMLSQIEKDKEKLTATVNSLEEANKLILANQDKLVEAEKFVAVGRLSAGLAHEIGNPLGIIQGYLELLGMDDIDSKDRQQYSRRATKELERMTRLIRQLLDFAKKKNATDSRTTVPPVIYELLEMLKYQKIVKNIHFETDCEDFAEEAYCSEADLHQVLLNCVLNSIDAIGEQDETGGKIILSCSLRIEEVNKFAEIKIRDNGKGVKCSEISSVFDPFFTTKEVGCGTGLGLSVSRSIVENCGGTMRLESEVSTGTCVTIMLPVE